MNIRILELIDGAQAAKGLTVIIDVFRAMTVEAYVIHNGAADLIPMGDIEAAYAYREAHPECRHPRIAVLSDGPAAAAVWTKKHPVTERGEVSKF